MAHCLQDGNVWRQFPVFMDNPLIQTRKRKGLQMKKSYKLALLSILLFLLAVPSANALMFSDLDWTGYGNDSNFV